MTVNSTSGSLAGSMNLLFHRTGTMDSYHREEDVSTQAGDRTDRKWKTKLRTTFYPCMTVREATMTKTVLDLTMELKTTETHTKIRSMDTTKNRYESFSCCMG
jgi:hypothetical protein